MTAPAIRFNSPAERHSYEVGLKLIADRLEADRQKRAFAGIDTAAIVRSAAAEAVAGLKRFRAQVPTSKPAKAKGQNDLLISTKPKVPAKVAFSRPAPPPVVRSRGTMHKFCMGPICG